MRTIVAVVACCVVVFADAAWVDDWQRFNGDLQGEACSLVDPSNCTPALCTHIDAEIRMLLTFNVTDSEEPKTVTMYVPSDSVINEDLSTCANGSNILGYREVTYVPQSPFDSPYTINQTIVKAETTIELYNGSAWLTLFFSNDTSEPYNVPGWFAFSIYRIELTIDTNDTLMNEHFGKATDIADNGTLSFGGWSGDTPSTRWWKKLGAYFGTSYKCRTRQSVWVNDQMTFEWQNVNQVAALNLGLHPNSTTKTNPPNQCNFDYERSDGVAVIIGTVQTVFTILCLIVYFIYLKKRGPVRVPDWIIEPAMRNAEVKPINEEQFERRLTQLSSNEPNGVSQRQATELDEKY